jgi:hypothetical protein
VLCQRIDYSRFELKQSPVDIHEQLLLNDVTDRAMVESPNDLTLLCEQKVSVRPCRLLLNLPFCDVQQTGYKAWDS